MGVLKKVFAFRETPVVMVIILLSVILWIANPVFLSPANLSATSLGLAGDGILSIGMTLILITGGIDLSVGSILGVSMMTAAALFTKLNIDPWIGAIAALVVGGIVGLINGLLIGKLKLSPLISTLGMMSVARGITFVISKGSPLSLSGANESFRVLGSGSIGSYFPVFVLIFIVLAIIADIMVRRSAIIRKLFYTGSNEKAAILSGLNTSKIKVFTYLVAGILGAVAGVLTLSRFNVAVPNTGTGAELRVIAACVIGGASLNGGEGTILGSVLGVILMNVISNGLVLLNVSIYYQDLAIGLILLVAVTIDQMIHSKK